MPNHEALALRLRNAYRSGAVVPLQDGLDPADTARTYALQATNTRFWQAQARRIVRRKIGLTSKAEAEVALVLSRDVNNPNARAEDVAAATGYAVAAIEIVDSRITVEGWGYSADRRTGFGGV